MKLAALSSDLLNLLKLWTFFSLVFDGEAGVATL